MLIKIKYSIVVLLLLGCSNKYFQVNGLVCPADYSEQMVQRDLKECRYYDEKAIEESSKSPISPECRECLKEKGYRLKE